ncbi:MAG: hypothetical protein HY744_05820 [Deltaproteobacteria bacterium]|nr:hypothetical protein [Deltaproteobacteria bacterium]
MARRHRSFRNPGRRGRLPDVALLDGVVAPKILAAMHAASEQLAAARVRHALVGGLAVGAHGYPRATKDVDFLVGEEAFEHHGGGIVTIAPGVPIAVRDVAVDTLSIGPGEEHLDAALEEPEVTAGVPVVPLAVLVYLKMKSPRKKDAADVVELLKAGADARAILSYLRAYAPDMEDLFVELKDAADSEGDE